MGAGRQSNPPRFFLLVVAGLACRSDAFCLVPSGGPRRLGEDLVVRRKGLLKSWCDVFLG